MLVRRLALDLRNLADKTLELRGVVEDYRHDLVRTVEDDWCDPDELQALHRQIQELWEAMDRAEAAAQRLPPHVAPALARVALSLALGLPTEGAMIIVTRLHGGSRGRELRPDRAGRGGPGHGGDPGRRQPLRGQGDRGRDRRQGPRLPGLGGRAGRPPDTPAAGQHLYLVPNPTLRPEP
jgi:hypothetical protein